jgi:hypothetical protein
MHRQRSVRRSLILVQTGVLFLLYSSALAAADEPLNDEMQVEATALKSKIDLFFRQLSDKTSGSEGAAREAIGGIVGSGPLKDRSDDLAKLTEQAAMLPQRYGDYTGHEAAGAKAVGNDLLFLRYLYKGERFPVVWHFTFYRTTSPAGLKREWSLISLRFDTKIEMLER